MNAADRSRVGALLARAADGDRAALDPLFASAWPVVRAFCGRLVGDADGDDAAQETMLRVFERAPSFDRGRDGLTWMLTIAVWQCRTVRRRRGRRREEHGATAGARAGEGLSPAQVAERHELLAIAGEVLGAMPQGDASVLVAAWTDDAAARAAIAPATFRKRLERALARFRASWRARHDAT